MKQFHLVPVFLLCLFTCVFPSNPDSEIVQDSSEVGKEEGQKSAPYRMDDSQTRSQDSEKSGVSIVRIMRPFTFGSRIIWREVGVSQTLDKARDRTPMFGIRRNNRPDLNTPTDNRNIAGFNSNEPTPVSGNIPLRPSNTDRGNAPGVPEGGAGAYFPYIPSNNGENNTPLSGGDQGVRNSNGQQNPSNFQPGPNGQNRGTPVNRDFNRNVSLTINNGYRAPPARQTPQRVGSTRPPNVPTSIKRRISPDANLFAGIVNDFAFKMMETLNLKSNFVISPLSIFIALSMCYLGSDGATRAQLEQVLGLNENAVHGAHLHQGIKDLLSLISPESNEYQIFVANGLFLGKNFTADAQFAEEIQRYYNAEMKNLDFGNPDVSLPVINDWVAKSTRNMITSLIDRPPPLLTRLLLLNAIYFKGIWKIQFPFNLTYNGRFHSLDGNSKEVPTMVLYGETFPLFRSDDQRHSFIKLPYQGDQMSMIIALPYKQDEEPMPYVRDQTLCYVLDAMQDTNLDSVAIPKFKLEDVKSLRRPLMELGVRDIFNARDVDLRRLRKQNDVYVSAILHKAVVEVNEEGTTAAASTAVRFVPLSLRNPKDFVVNHPFAFYIVHEPSGLVLFYGKIYDLGGNVPTLRENVRPRPNSEDTASRNPSRVRIHGAVTYEDTSR